MTPEGVGLMQYRPAITNPTQTSAKIAALKPGTNYRIYIRATTKAGAGEPFFVEQQTKLPLPEGTLLDKPEFIHQLVATNNIFDTVRVMWSPKLDGNPGSHFYVKYRYFLNILMGQVQFTNLNLVHNTINIVFTSYINNTNMYILRIK
ncbi:neuroglian-like [Daktulosphaira vitifoliae]|uniref:neuroglian-like n=1 Tax=Daktulosphaira vitifoliae TaxID=58002 RepID=UPI0021AAF16D|nr:neuroglian-like [Daktulosphaira vitifoliae]